MSINQAQTGVIGAKFHEGWSILSEPGSILMAFLGKPFLWWSFCSLSDRIHFRTLSSNNSDKPFCTFQTLQIPSNSNFCWAQKIGIVYQKYYSSWGTEFSRSHKIVAEDEISNNYFNFREIFQYYLNDFEDFPFFYVPKTSTNIKFLTVLKWTDPSYSIVVWNWNSVNSSHI